jgi:hypothetical protein
MLYDLPQAADAGVNLSALLAHGDPWPDNPRLSLRNLARQLHSLRRATGLWLASARARGPYRFVVCLRPDLRFLAPLDLPRLAPALRSSALATPGWARWGGLNDRLAFGGPAAMAAYGLRGAALPAYVAAGARPHAERFLAAHLAARGVAHVDSAVVFQRVRAGGRIEAKDLSLAAPAPAATSPG